MSQCWTHVKHTAGRMSFCVFLEDSERFFWTNARPFATKHPQPGL